MRFSVIKREPSYFFENIHEDLERFLKETFGELEPYTADNKPFERAFRPAIQITENKNISTTVDAVERLRSEGVSIMLTVAGPIRDLQYDGYFAKYPFVTYLGKLTPEQVKVALRQSDLFVMPSHKETFGLVYAEAMSQGLPVLYTRGEGFDGQFPDGQVGYAVDDHDSRDVAEKIKAVMANYDAMAWQAYEGCVRFSWPHLAEQYRDLYQKQTSQLYAACFPVFLLNFVLNLHQFRQLKQHRL